MSRVFAYCRVSTATGEQTTENQVQEITGAGFAMSRTGYSKKVYQAQQPRHSGHASGNCFSGWSEAMFSSSPNWTGWGVTPSMSCRP